MKKRTLVIFVLLIILFGGCTSSVEEGDVFFHEIGLPIENPNVDLKLIISPDAESAYKEIGLIAMIGINKTDLPIQIDHKSGVEIYHKVDGKWIQIPNDMNYPERGLTIPPDSPLGIDIIYLPDYCALQKKELVRFLVIGRQENPKRQIGAYRDITVVNRNLKKCK